MSRTNLTSNDEKYKHLNAACVRLLAKHGVQLQSAFASFEEELVTSLLKETLPAETIYKIATCKSFIGLRESIILFGDIVSIQCQKVE